MESPSDLESTSQVAWYHLTPAVTAVFALVSLALASHVFLRWLVVPIVHAVVKRSRIGWDDVFAHPQVLHRLGIFVPLVILHQGMPFMPGLGGQVNQMIQRLLAAGMVIVAVAVVSGLCTAANTLYAHSPASRIRPIKGYLQVVRLVAVIVGVILVIASLIDRSPWYLLSGLGAMTAVLMLVFRDSILGLVAGVHMSANGLVHVGDWLEMPQFDADGEVIDISLNVVQVQNWDKTITAIPAHKFLENSFKNWRGMQSSGGRRIARSMDIDVATIRFCTPEMLAGLRGLLLLEPYLAERQRDIDAWNQQRNIDAGMSGNGRRMTNIGCFRAYVDAYVRNHAQIRKDMTLMVRQLAPGPTGLPIQVYAFTATVVWAEYEGIQADIFDHLYSVLPHFGLRPFQHPAGNDVRSLQPLLAPESTTPEVRSAYDERTTEGGSSADTSHT